MPDIDAIQTKLAFDAIAFAAFTLVQHRNVYQKLDEQHRHMDNVGGLLDPTLYRQMLHSERYATNKAAADAALAFLRALEEIPTWNEAMKLQEVGDPLKQFSGETTAAEVLR